MITQTSTRQVEPDIAIFEIAGRLSLGNTLAAIEDSIRALISSGVRKLVVDLSALRAIDSSGLGTLLACSGAMEQAGGSLRVAGACGSVAASFALVHLDAIMKLDPDLQTSFGHLARVRSSSAATAPGMDSL